MVDRLVTQKGQGRYPNMLGPIILNMAGDKL